MYYNSGDFNFNVEQRRQNPVWLPMNIKSRGIAKSLIKNIRPNKDINIFGLLYSFILILLSIAIIFYLTQGALLGFPPILEEDLPMVVFMTSTFLFLGVQIWKDGNIKFLEDGRINFANTSVRILLFWLLDIIFFSNSHFPSYWWEICTTILASIYIFFGNIFVDVTIKVTAYFSHLINFPYEQPEDLQTRHIFSLISLALFLLLPETWQIATALFQAQSIRPLVNNSIFAGALAIAARVAHLEIAKTGRVNNEAIAAIVTFLMLLSRSSTIISGLSVHPVRATFGLAIMGLPLYLYINWDRLKNSPAALLINVPLYIAKKAKEKYCLVLETYIQISSCSVAINIFFVSSFIYLLMHLTQIADDFPSEAFLYYGFFIYVLFSALSVHILLTRNLKIDGVPLRTLVITLFLMVLYYSRLDFPVRTVQSFVGIAIAYIYFPRVILRFPRYIFKKLHDA
jgi:hypothetical protein